MESWKDPYKITKNGDVFVITDKDDRKVDQKENNQEFCDFLSWHSTQPGSDEFKPIGKVEYFCDKARLVKHLKTWAALVYGSGQCLITDPSTHLRVNSKHDFIPLGKYGVSSKSHDHTGAFPSQTLVTQY